MKFKILAGIVAAAVVSSAYALAIARTQQSTIPDSPVASQKEAAAGKKRPAPGETVLRTSPKQDRLAVKNAPPQFEEAPPVELIVNGIATGDLLNIRVRPSPGARIVARLDNGEVVKKLGCQAVEGRRWCMIELPFGERKTGWAAGRYLTGLDGAPVAN